MLHRWWGVAGAVTAALVAGCATDSADPTADQDLELASAFEAMAGEANGRGDPDESAAFSGAAMAVRLGIRPTEIGVTIGDESRRYLAFVHVIRHSQRDANAPALRTMVAYRARPDSKRPAEVLYLATTGDSGEISLPSLTKDRPIVDGFAGATWKDLVNQRFWAATSGKAGIAVESTGEACPKPSARGNPTCHVAEFGVLLDGQFHLLVRNQRGEVDRSRTLAIGTRSGGVNGAVLVFN
jgi:hypothetical protein